MGAGEGRVSGSSCRVLARHFSAWLWPGTISFSPGSLAGLFGEAVGLFELGLLQQEETGDAVLLVGVGGSGAQPRGQFALGAGISQAGSG